jgi:CelD/BcsL family acetyltransferase involved in cellulose biosynthesis
VFEVSVENAFDFQSPEYAELFAMSASTAFQHPAWLTALYAKLMPHNGARPLIVVVRFAADKRLAMVLPLVRRRYAGLQVIEFADLRVSDYASPVADTETFAQILGDAAAGNAIRRALKPYDILRIAKLSDQGLPLERLLDNGKRQDMGMNAYATPLDSDFANWRQQRLGQSYRKELDKKSRQLHRRGNVRFACTEDPDELRTTFDAMRIYRRIRFDHQGGGELLQIDPYFDFYLGIATEARGSFARVYTCWMDDRPIAGVMGLAHQGAFLVILGGFDQAGYKNQSIGSLMFEQVARDCIERGESLLDFTIGDEPYKLIFGAQPQPVWQVSRAGSPLGFAAGLLVENFPAAKALARKLFQESRDLGKKAGALGRRPLAGASDEAPTP